MIAEVDPHSSGKFGYSGFLSVVARSLKGTSTAPEIISALRLLDPSATRHIHLSELQPILCDIFPETLTNREISDTISSCGSCDGMIQYEELVWASYENFFVVANLPNKLQELKKKGNRHTAVAAAAAAEQTSSSPDKLSPLQDKKAGAQGVETKSESWTGVHPTGKEAS